VHLNLRDEAAFSAAYRDLANRIDPRVLVAPMIAAQGVEMLLGMIHDEQFGPVVLVGAGGVHVEALADAVYALPPFDAAEAERLVARLRVAPLLHSPRHRWPLALEEFYRIATRFSGLAADLGGELSEIDLNPVIVHADGCVIVDALVVPRAAHNREPERMRQAR
jgi:acetate---CoA ligase (ADP-forming)